MTRDASSPARGARIVLTSPLTETIDHAGYFIQMAMASLPVWMEGLLNRRYPGWRRLDRNDDGSARTMPVGVRILEAALQRRFPPADIVCCYADVDLLHEARRRGLFAIFVLNGPAFTWPLFLFAGLLPESWLMRLGTLHRSRPLRIKTRAELLATIKPHQWKFLRPDTGDVPEAAGAAAAEDVRLIPLSPSV